MPSLLHHSVPLAASRPHPSRIDYGPSVTRLDNAVFRRPYDPDVENGEDDAQQQQQQEVPSDAIIGLCYHQRMVGCAWFHSHSHTVSFHSASLALDDRYSSSSSSSTAASPPHSLLYHHHNGMQERSGGAGGLSDPSLLLEEDPPLWFQALTDSLWNHHHQRTTAHNNSIHPPPTAAALSTMRLCCCADTPYCFVRPFQRLSSSSSSRQQQQGAEQLEAHQEQAAFSSSPSLPSSSVSICNKGERSVAFLRQQLALLWPHVTPAEWTVRLPMQDLRIVAAISFVLEACIRQGVLVADIVPEAPPSLVAVDAHTLAALRIFRTEDHPLAHHGVGQGKEGLSLFALLSMHCCTSMGRDLLRRWLSGPSNDAALLSRRQEAIGALLPQHRLRTEIGKLLPSIPHCGRLLCRLQAGTHGTQTYASLRVAARTYTQLMRLLSSSSSSSPEGSRLAALPCVRRLLETYHHDAVDTFASMIETTIDCSRRGGGGVPRDVRGAAVRNVRILPGVDSELDELRQHVERLGPYLTETAKLVASELTDQEPFRSWHLQCVFVPRVGYLMAVPSTEVFRSDAATDAAAEDTAAVVAMSPPDGGGGDGFALERSEHNAATGTPLPPARPPQEGLRPVGWELLYTAHAVVYFRTPHTRELDERIGDVHAALVDRCGVVQAEFDTRLLSVGFAVLPTLHVAELDAILALTRVAHDHGWTRPKWSSFSQEGRTDERGGGGGGGGGVIGSEDDNVPLIDIRGAVHPLLRSCGMHVVPIDFNSRLRDKPASLSVLLGANGSGKSTYLQTIGTVCYLAHIGSFVPCPAAGGCTFSRPLQRLECIAAGSKDGAFLGTTSSFVHEMALLARATATAQSSSPSHHLGAAAVGGGGGGTNLLLVDEFGRGTLASDGVSLLASVLHSFRVYHSSERSRAAASPSFPSSVVLLSSHYSELRHLIRTVPQLSGIRVLYTTTTTTTTSDTSGDAEGADVFSPLFTVRPDDAEEDEDQPYYNEDDVKSLPQAHLVARAPRDSSYHAECMQAFACAVRHGVLPSVVRRGALLCEARRAEQRKQQLAWDADSTTRVAGELTMLLRRYEEEEGEGGREITTRNTGGPDVGAEEEAAN